MLKENRKSILKITLSLFAAIVFSLSFILIVNASVTPNGTAPTTVEIEVGENLSYDTYDDISTWFDTVSEGTGGSGMYDQSLSGSNTRMEIDPAPTGDCTFTQYDGFSFTPDLADADKDFTVTFYVKGTNADSPFHEGTPSSVSFTISVKKPATPQPNFTINYVGERLYGYVRGGDYTINGVDYENVTESIAIDDDWFGETIEIVHIGDETHSDSAAQELFIPARPDAPEISKTDETYIGGNNGTITGLDTGLEYQYSPDGSLWYIVSGSNSIIGIAPGTYYIRLTADASTFASAYATVTINASAAYQYGLVLKSNGLYYNDELLDNRDPKLGGGLAVYTYNISTKTLTLSFVDFTTAAATALDLTQIDGVTISVGSPNSFTSTTGVGIKANSFSVKDGGALTAAGVTAGISLNADSVITINSGAVTVNGVTGISSSAYSDLVMNGGVLNVNGSTNAYSNMRTVTYPAAYSWTNASGSGTVPGGNKPLSYTPLTITTLTGVNPTTYTFNKAAPADFVFTYSRAPGTGGLSGVKIDGASCLYTVDGNEITIAQSVLSALSVDSHTITLDFPEGTDPTITLTVTRIYDKMLEFKTVDTVTGLYYNEAWLAANDEKLGGGSYEWDADSSTLTLNGVNFTTMAARALDLSAVSDVTLDLSGDNSFISVYNGSANTYGIYSSESVTIKSTTDTGTLTATGGTSTATNKYVNGIRVPTLTIDSGTIYAYSNSGDYSFGVFSTFMTVNGGSVTATSTFHNNLSRGLVVNSGGYLNITGGTLTATGFASADSSGILSFSPVTISDGTVTATGYKYGLYASNTDTTAPAVTISGGTVTATAATTGGLYAGTPSGTVDILISGGTITATGGNYGLYATQNHEIAVSGGILNLTGETSAFNKTPADFSANLPEYYRYKTDDDTNYTYSWSRDYSGSHEHVLIETRTQAFDVTVTNGSADSEKYEEGDTVIITPSDPASGYRILSVTTDIRTDISAVGDGTYSFTMPGEAIEVTVAYELIPPDTYTVTVTNGTADAEEYNSSEKVTITPNVPATGYRIKSVTTDIRTDISAVGDGTYTFTMPAEDVVVTVTYERIPNPNPGTGNNTPPTNTDIAPPPKQEDAEPEMPENDDDNDDNDTNITRGSTAEIDGVQSDIQVGMPTEADDPTAEVVIDGKTIETYSLTAAEAIADGEVRTAFISGSGAIAVVTKGGTVISGGNKSASLNSETTLKALENAAEQIIQDHDDRPEDIEKPVIPIAIGQEITGVSKKTIEKIINLSNEYNILTELQKIQYSETEDPQENELIYRITLPVSGDNIRDIRLGAEFDTAVVEASKIAFTETFGNTDCAGFALTQKDTFGAEATIQVKLSAIGFDAEPGDTVYIAIFNPETGNFTEVKGFVGNDGFVSFTTETSGVVIMSATSFMK
jgi:hypothetical protein